MHRSIDVTLLILLTTLESADNIFGAYPSHEGRACLENSREDGAPHIGTIGAAEAHMSMAGASGKAEV